jgi:hypothetical protein
VLPLLALALLQGVAGVSSAMMTPLQRRMGYRGPTPQVNRQPTNQQQQRVNNWQWVQQSAQASMQAARAQQARAQQAQAQQAQAPPPIVDVPCTPAASGSAVAAISWPAGPVLERGLSQITQANTHLLERWAKHQVPVAVQPMGGKSAQVVQVATESGKFILRRPRRSNAHGLRVNSALQKLAGQLGEPELIPAAVEATVAATIWDMPPGTQVMLVKHVGDRFRNFLRVPPLWFPAVAERTRLVAAVIDLLSEQRDRKRENLFLSQNGEVRLIDPDKTFGQNEGAVFRSQFFPGERLAYCSAQNRFEDLPVDLRDVITEIGNATPEALMQSYGLQAEEVAVMQAEAKQIQTLGLTAAIKQFLQPLQLHPTK